MGGYGAAALSAVGVTSGIVAGGTAAAAGVTEGVKKIMGSKRDDDGDDDYDYEYSDDDDDESYSKEKRAWRRKHRQAVGGEEDENSDDESSEDEDDEDDEDDGSDSSSINPSEGSPNEKGSLSDEVPAASNIPPAGGDSGDDTYEKMFKRVQARREARSRN